LWEATAAAASVLPKRHVRITAGEGHRTGDTGDAPPRESRIHGQFSPLWEPLHFPQSRLLTKVALLIPTKAVFDTWVARTARTARVARTTRVQPAPVPPAHRPYAVLARPATRVAAQLPKTAHYSVQFWAARCANLGAAMYTAVRRHLKRGFPSCPYPNTSAT
jgi:hypothetical protein